jgi:transcriptional regulator with XRE-family HTH domain
MLSLRTAIGLTQKGLAEHLGVSRRAVGEWEAGNSYPKVGHLKQLVALAVRQRAFPVGKEAQEIRKLWKMAHQKVLLDEYWLSALLEQPCFPERVERSEKQMVKAHGGEVLVTRDQPFGGLCPEVEIEERNDPVVLPIYPTDWGRFALGSPSGKVLYPGQWVEIFLAGYRIAGTIYAGALGDYFQSADGTSCCGLCAGMCVIAYQ